MGPSDGPKWGLEQQAALLAEKLRSPVDSGDVIWLYIDHSGREQKVVWMGRGGPSLGTHYMFVE